MRINFSINAINHRKINNVSFKKKSDDEILRDLQKIETAIQEIINNPDYSISLAKVAKLSGIPYGIVSSRLNHPLAGEVNRLWQSALYLKENSEDRKTKDYSGYVHKLSQEDIERDVDKINNALLQLIEKQDFPVSIAKISCISGLSVNVVYSRLRTPQAVKVVELWNNSPNKKRLPVYYGKKGVSKASDINRDKQIRTALRIIESAINQNRKLRYEELEKSCGMSKEEVDKLIEVYARYKNSYSERKQALKDMQAKWYKEHLEKEELFFM